MAHITDVLRKPVLTEKTMKLMQEENKYTFDVALSSNKTEIKQAVEAMFNVKVTSVNTINVRAKTKRVGRYVGKTARRTASIYSVKKNNLYKLLKCTPFQIFK